jgi:hypothetical protein
MSMSFSTTSSSSSARQADAGAARLLAQYRAQQAPQAADAGHGNDAGASLDLVIDGRHRVRLQALPGGGIRVASRLRALPEPGFARDQLVRSLGRLACGTMLASPCACVIDARERAAWLQITVAAGSTQDIDDAVGELANALAFWTPAVAAA